MKTKIKTTSESAIVGNTVLGDVLPRLHKAGYHFRLEDDEEGYYLSIINRQLYPRIWVDNFQDNAGTIIAETPDNLLNRTILFSKDWSERWFGRSINECLYQAYEWMSAKDISLADV